MVGTWTERARWAARAAGGRELDRRGERGATAAEYAIMVSLIAVVIVVAVGAVGLATLGLFTSVIDNWP